uniref:Uncharacterized protein n=1 Tax=Tetradesmus obliquus TaxID=3088 RepID=A0A383WD07_TETOB|eukprot:jgi/Sobl393_1/5940/SZX75505.1
MDKDAVYELLEASFAVADAANAKTPKLQAKAIAVVHWLLNSLPEARLAEHPSIPAGLLAIPSVPQHLARELCHLGVKVPYKQIVAAARQRVEGVEVWITVQSCIGLAGDIPALIKALYSNDGCNFIDRKYGRVDQADVRDLLHLSINSSSADIPLKALGVFCRLHTQLSTAEVLHLLCTAVEGKHTEVLISILQLLGNSSLDGLTPEQLLPIIERAVVLEASALSGCNLSMFSAYQPPVRLRDVIGLPGAQQLPADAVAALMHKALELGVRGCLNVLCELPAAKDISADQLASIVEAAAANGDHFSLRLLAAAPAFHQLQRLQLFEQRCRHVVKAVLQCFFDAGQQQLIVMCWCLL